LRGEGVQIGVNEGLQARVGSQHRVWAPSPSRHTRHTRHLGINHLAHSMDSIGQSAPSRGPPLAASAVAALIIALGLSVDVPGRTIAVTVDGPTVDFTLIASG